MSEEKPKRFKFKWTKELVNIAINDGMTQEQIARVCRVEQSIVSNWKNGKYKATEQQLAELLRRYSARLNRTATRVYLVCAEPTGKWQDTDIGQRLIALRDRHIALDAKVEEHQKAHAARKKAEREAEQERLHTQDLKEQILAYSFARDEQYQLTDAEQSGYEQIRAATNELQKIVAPHSQQTGNYYLKDLIELYREDFAAKGQQHVVQVEGTVLFRYTFCELVGRAYRRGLDIGREPVRRWIVHDLSRGNILLVSQQRRRLVGTAKVRWAEEFNGAKDAVANLYRQSPRLTVPPLIPSETVECMDDSARWSSSLRGPMTVEDLLKFVDEYLSDPQTQHNPHDEQVLPYLLRKALVEHGHPVPGVERIMGS